MVLLFLVLLLLLFISQHRLTSAMQLRLLRVSDILPGRLKTKPDSLTAPGSLCLSTTPSPHAGARQASATQTPLWQSAATAQPVPAPHGPQLAPQSTPVPAPLRTASLQPAAWQWPPPHTRLKSKWSTTCRPCASRRKRVLSTPRPLCPRRYCARSATLRGRLRHARTRAVVTRMQKPSAARAGSASNRARTLNWGSGGKASGTSVRATANVARRCSEII